MNKFLTKIAGLFLGMAMAIGVGVAVGSNGDKASVARAVNYTDVHVLDTTGNLQTDNNTYGSTGTATTGGIEWTFTGNGKINPWRLGGKTAQSGNQPFYTGTAISGDVDRIVVEFGDISGLTASSFQMSVHGSASDAASGSNAIETHTGLDIGGNTTATIDLTNKQSGKFYRFVPKLSISSSNNKYLQLKKVTFKQAQSQASKTLSSIALSGTYPTSFTVGDAFSHEGMTVTATYDDTTTDDVTNDATFTGYDMNTAGNQTVTVSYTEGGTTKTAEYSITVNAQKTPKSLSSSGQTTTFDSGDKFAYGGTLTVTYTDDTTNSTISPASFKIGDANIDPTSAGTEIIPGTTALARDDHNGKTVYVLYTENNTTVYTSYVITVNKISSVTFTYGTDNSSTSTLTKSGVTLTIGTPGTDGTFDTNNNDCYKIYKGKTLIVSSSTKIAKIEFTCTAEGTAQYGPGCFSASVGSYAYSSYNGTWTGSTTSVTFTASSNQVRPTVIKVTFESTDPLVELDASSATSVSMMKGDPNTSIKVRVLNITTKTWTFTFDEGEDEGLSTSSYISVSAGEAVNDVHTLTITTKAVGSTVLHISVSGTACATTIPVTVNPKPASMQIVHSDISEGELEIITGAKKQVSFSGEDTDGNGYAIAAGDVTPSAQSGASHVTLSSSQITGASAGDAVVRYTLNALTSVYAEITVHVVDDYIATVGTPTFATNLADTQGQSPTVDVFASRPGTMYSGASTTIPFENYKFSYDETYASAKYASAFTYDFSHGTTVDPTHKTQTINVFCDIDEAAHGSYTITVEQLNDPLTAIAFTNVTNNELDVTRGSTFQLEWSYTPENPTDGKEVEFVIDDNTDGIDITVSSTGLISIGASSDLGTALVLVQSAHDDTIQDYVYVTAVLESMKYTVSETESWDLVSNPSTLKAGDVVVVTGVKNNNTLAMGTYSSGNNVKAVVGSPLTVSNNKVTAGITDAMIYTLVAGKSNGTLAFKDSAGKYLNVCSSGDNYMRAESEVTVDSSFTLTNSGSVYASGSSYSRKYMRFNPNGNNDALFSCYASSSTTGTLVTFYKRSGGNTEMDVTEDLYNAVHNNFGGAGKTYEWNESCSTFDQDGWLDACIAITEIADYDDYKLNRAVGNMSGNEVEVFLAKYDIIIGKVGTDHDHLGRFSTGGINAKQRITVPTAMTVIENNEAILIVVLVSIVTVTCAGGYFFLRRRKED